MTTTISGTTGASLVQDGVINTATLAAGSVTPVKTQVGALPSMVRVQSANGYGSTNTAIRRFSNVLTNQGADITYADSATLGATFTINTSGVYQFTFGESLSSLNYFGISLNTTQLTTAVQLITATDRVALSCTSGADTPMTCSNTMYLASGAIIRAHGPNSSGSQAALAQFIMVRVA